MQDIATQKYQFIITPLQIISKPNSVNSHNKKSIIIKLGQSIAKCSQLGTSVRLITQVLYSSINQKYCPVKGIIKIYDVVDQQNQIISCIGTFQAEDILQQKISKQTIMKNIGSVVLKMEVKANKMPHRSSIQLQNQKNSSIQIVSSQNMIQILQGSQQLVSSQKMEQELNKLGGLRRGNFSAISCKNDIVDLKQAINFGSSRQNSSLNSKVQNKMPQLARQANIQDSFSYSNLTKKQLKNNSLIQQKNTICKINLKLKQAKSLQQKIMEIDAQSDTDCNVMLELESNISQQKNAQDFLPCPPYLLNNHNPTISNTSKSHSQDFYQQQKNQPQLIKSIRILQKKIQEKEVSKSTNINYKQEQTNIKSKFQKSGHTSNLKNFEQAQDKNNQCNQNNVDLTNSNASVATSLISYPQLLQEYQKNQIEALGQMLVEQRRKNLLFQQKHEKLQLKIITLKQKYSQILQKWEKWCQNGLKFLQSINKDSQGNYVLQIYKQKGLISFRYNMNQKSEENFCNFLTHSIQNCTNYEHNLQQREANGMNLQLNSHVLNTQSKFSIDNFETSSPQLDQVLQKINFTYQNNTKLLKLNQQQQKNLKQTQNQLRNARNSIQALKQQKHSLNEQKVYMQNQIQYLQGQIDSLTGINKYLKQKDWQMQSIITLKQGAIQNMKKIMQSHNQQMDKMQQQISIYKKGVQNKQLMLEQMRQQLADKQQIIQAYKEIYGQVKKSYKSRQSLSSYIGLCVESILQKDKEQIGACD